MLAIEWIEKGFVRYGFHGTSFRYANKRAAEIIGRSNDENLCEIICHLGGGCSLAAVRGNRCVDTTMGLCRHRIDVGKPWASRRTHFHGCDWRNGTRCSRASLRRFCVPGFAPGAQLERLFTAGYRHRGCRFFGSRGSCARQENWQIAAESFDEWSMHS
jgi:hypothetical protein